MILIIVSGVGTILMFGLRSPPASEEDEVPGTTGLTKKTRTPQAPEEKEVPSVVESLQASAALWATPDMLWFSFTLFYTGLHLTLWDGLFSTCIGFTGG